MVFSSIVFLFFFLPLTLFINFLCPKICIKNAALLILSLLFYAWGEPVYVFLMLFSITINYFFGLGISFFKNKAKKILLIVCILLNFLILFHFKYFSFALKMLFPIFQKLNINIQNPSLVLPIGISFYTFQIISYIVDIYRKPKMVQKNPLNLGLYISFFPQLIAGPIVRYHDINAQIENRSVDLEKLVLGFERFIIGFAKKVLLANVFALYADSVLNLKIAEYPAIYAWFSMLAYSLQIFFDFSGYSDMAIGLGKMFGFDFAENFNYPYAARSITDFWRRWHISLSSWFKEYLYIPLGGNKKGNFRTIFNIFIVFLATGVWHGAGLNFIVWGLGHGTLRIAEKIISNTKLASFFNSTKNKILIFAKNFICHFYTLVSVFFLWIFFRKGTMGGIELICKMFGINWHNILNNAGEFQKAFELSILYNSRSIVVFAVGILFCFPWWKIFYKLKDLAFFKKNSIKFALQIVKYFALLLLLLFSISCLMNSSYNPFIYFRF